MTPYKNHLFICVNDRGDGKESCAQKGAQALRDEVKKLCKGIDGVRINNSGCLGPCETGINAVLYPQGEWFTHLKPEDAARLVDAVKKSEK